MTHSVENYKLLNYHNAAHWSNTDIGQIILVEQEQAKLMRGLKFGLLLAIPLWALIILFILWMLG